MSTTQQPEPGTKSREGDAGDAQTATRPVIPAEALPERLQDDPARVETEVGSVGLFDEEVVLTPSDDTLQWRAEVLQMVNWGGFSGRISIDLHADATMISGASGVGKSTLLDAYTALMMPSDTRFNGASNDAVTGRARGAGQRNLLSYLRGAVDVVDDPRTGRPVERLLRGRDGDTWGAVAMTFVNDQERRFTALRTYYVPRRATRSGEVQMQLVTLDAAIDLATLEAAVPDRFHANTLKKLSPGLRVHRTYTEFSAVLHARLGIGANGDGAKALGLLARIQAGNQVRSVDELYKEMVLERPATFGAADRAVEHFDALESAYSAMRTEEEKQDLLAPITELHARKVAARERAAELDAYGVTATGDTPVRYWLLRTHARLLGAGVEANRQDRAAVRDELRAADRRVAELSADLDAARDEHRDAGGASVGRLDGEIERERLLREERRARRETLLERLAPLAVLDDDGGERIDPTAALASREAFAALADHAEQWLAGHVDAGDRLVAERDELLAERYPLLARRTELQGERASLEGRSGRVPEHLHAMRREVARASGLSVSELPFVAELLDVAPEESRWRLAIETVLGATARTMLVPLPRLEEFSAAIDSLRLRGRLTFEGAQLGLDGPDLLDPEQVAGKLVFADSPFRGWVQRHVAEPARNALCVESADDLRGGGFRVTLAGQTRSGRRGSHGRGDQRSIIGFSNSDALAEIDADIAALEAELRAVDERIARVETATRVQDRRRTAYDALGTQSFDDLDVAACDQRLADLERRREQILTADDRLGTTEQQMTELAERLEAARLERFRLDERRRRLELEHAELVDSEDLVNDELERIASAGHVVCTEEQARRLDEEFRAAADPDDPEDLDRFHESSGRLQARLTAAVQEAQVEVEHVDRELAAIFRAYQLHWADPNLGTTADSYPDFARILADIEATGLPQRRAEWRRRLTEWSGQDLVPLAGAMSSSVEEIEDRLEPINAILRRLEFGAEKDRLRIRLRRLAPAHVQVFLRELRELSRGTVRDLDEAALEERFTRLRRFMGQLRGPAQGADPERVGERERLLDVRRHVEVSAERYDRLTGELKSTYRTLGEKSGGESQELVAFIVGSALRFRLGDEMRSRPRFAPVFLDEGFVKADSEFAGRAVRAWKGLGFQLVIAVPLDKVTGLEPHMDALLVITKHTDTQLSSVFRVSDAQANG
ncbi:ATP-binding protein [Nocardioides ochotonae]|uniref:ATP-binding protein n=1 Tax=Nocardioides ochotonae TaxID=2685869 RepID=UPI00140D2C5D|nr:SbcC/MukB-like Walker B domain-containing protein [Nocardioides ochotonae]